MFVARVPGGGFGECPKDVTKQAYTCPACGGGLRYKDRVFRTRCP